VRKSLSCETTYAKDLKDLAQIRAEVERLARETAESLVERKLRARTVTLKVRYSNFSTVTRNHTAEVPTYDPGEFAIRALALLDRTDAGRRPVRLLGVGAHGLLGEGSPSPAEDEVDRSHDAQ